MTSPALGQPSYRALFRVAGMPRLALGSLGARTAASMLAVALVLLLLARFHSPTVAGVGTFLSIAPGLLVSPVAGALLDRRGR
ncbi:MAG TPA: hypothetical protein VFH45_00060, partial [Acidimicrobiales bacterium]|nr:hypothetical protein [Acidimicrobiales bacterium]